ncbi:hypothetical protein AAG570_000650 [Ranatra chinensis]|uniref:Uncharacterized protein n=1 Tax=Ranatra chinensis TaxID=642074 RepID=A0ABD0YXP5_9HEMI
MASKRRNMFYQNKKQETTEIAIDKLSETEKKHKEDILKQTSEHQKMIEEKSHQQEVLHQQMIKAKEEDHERMLKRLKEQQSEFQKMQDEDRRIIDSKSDEVKQTMEKIFEVQVEGTKKVDETREHLTRQYKEELERASAKTEAKAKELADANEKILNTQKEGAEMVQKISKEKDAEKEKAIEKMEERKAKDLEMIQAVHKSELDSAKQQDFKSFQNALMEKDKVITAGHEKMLEYCDSPAATTAEDGIEETMFRKIRKQETTERVSQVQESRIRDLKIMSAHDKMNQALIMLSAMNNANNPAQNQLLNLLVQRLILLFSGKSHDILGTPNQVYQYWLETLDKSCQECSSGINTVKELKSRKVIALIEAAASHHVTLNESLLKTWDEFACCSTGQSSQLSDLRNQLKDFVQLISNEIESHKNRWDVTMMKTQCAAICEPLIDVIRSYLPGLSERQESVKLFYFIWKKKRNVAPGPAALSGGLLPYALPPPYMRMRSARRIMRVGYVSR